NDIFTGGAPVFLKEAKLYDKAFFHKNVQILYGSTEAEPISSIAVAELAAETYTFNLKQGIPVGAIFHKTQVKIIPITDQPLLIFLRRRLKVCNNRRAYGEKLSFLVRMSSHNIIKMNKPSRQIKS